jgi:hypothetical protein
MLGGLRVVHPVEANVEDGGSLLIVRTNDGKVSELRLYHFLLAQLNLQMSKSDRAVLFHLVVAFASGVLGILFSPVTPFDSPFVSRAV